MKRYKNMNGESGVLAYELREDAIVIQFSEDGTYLYDASAPGRAHVEAMKRLAEKGEGLATYINKHVRGNYAAKL